MTRFSTTRLEKGKNGSENYALKLKKWGYTNPPRTCLSMRFIQMPINYSFFKC